MYINPFFEPELVMHVLIYSPLIVLFALLIQLTFRGTGERCGIVLFGNNKLQTYNPGDTCYIVLNNARVAAVTVIRRQGSLYTLRMGHAALRLPAGRLYPTWEAAAAALPERRRQERGNRPPRLH